ncbi:MAG: hypothetical protein QW356_08250 [Candidatus Hadarchaeales archaeon]
MKEDSTTLLAASTLAIITTVFWPECTLLWAIPAAVMLGIVVGPKKLGKISGKTEEQVASPSYLVYHAIKRLKSRKKKEKAQMIEAINELFDKRIEYQRSQEFGQYSTVKTAIREPKATQYLRGEKEILKFRGGR